MAFCSNCGTEIIPGNKYCTECGTPVEESTQPASPQQPPETLPPVPEGKSGKNKPVIFVLIGIIAVCIIAAAVILSGITLTAPAKSSPVSSGPQVSVTPTSYAIVTALDGNETQAVATTQTVKIVDSDRFGSNYARVYSFSRNFSYGQKETFIQDLTTPPLYIKFSLVPVNISRHRLVGIGTSREQMINSTEPSPNAWFEVKIYDIDNNEQLVEQQGYGKDYSDLTKQEFMVRQKGNYRIEFSGHEVAANVDVLTGIS